MKFKHIKINQYKNTVATLIASAFIFCTPSIALSQVIDSVESSVVQEIKNNASKKMKIEASAIDYIGKSDVPGMYLIMIDGFSTTFMSDSSLSKVMIGQYVDTAKNQSISAAIKAQYHKVTPSSFNTAHMIVDKKGNGARKVYVFADANCGWCKKFETDVLQKLNNVTIYTLPVSILQPGGATDQKVKHLLCQPEEAQAKLWENLLLNKVGDTGDSCVKSNALNLNTQLAKKNKFNGTPTIVFENGAVQGGASSLADFESKLNLNSFRRN